MELDAFINETLTRITKGVKEAQGFANENDARINPHINANGMNTIPAVFYRGQDGLRALTTIDFDIAVTISNQKESGIEGGIKVFPLMLAGKIWILIVAIQYQE